MATKRTVVTTKPKGRILHFQDDELFRKIRTIFEERGYPGLSLTSMVRMALADWTITKQQQNK